MTADLRRPLYQTAEDSAVQSRALCHVCGAWEGVTGLEFPTLSCVDWLLYNRETNSIALGELKARANPRDKYPTLILSKEKLDRALAAAAVLHVSFILFVEWCEGIFWLRITNTTGFKVARGGRVDRADPDDLQDVYHIPVRDFRLLLKRKEAPA